MNGFALNNIQNAYVGSTQVSAIYYGSTLIWPTTPHDYSLDYLTFEAIQPTTFTFTRNALQYSLDNGSTWTTLAAGNSTPQLSIGDKILWKQTGLSPAQYNGIGTFSATGNFKAYGNIMSLYYGDNFVGEDDLTGKDYAFYVLFNANTYLVNAENLILPATTLAISCYDGMYNNCTSLTTAPELPATTLTNGCYQGMFRYCESLTTAPELSATTLIDGCYGSMFEGCTSLNYIKCLATNISASGCTNNWVQNVAASGTFIRDTNMTAWTIGANGIPTNWTVDPPLPHDYSRDYLTFEAIQPTTFTFSTNNLQYSLDDGATWTTLTAGTATSQLAAGDKILWKQTGLTPSSTSPYGIGTFSATGNFKAYGNVMSLYYGDNFVGEDDLTGKDNAFRELFINNNYLIDVQNLILPATTLVESCYRSMFDKCYSLTSSPELPAITMAPNCYRSMFNGNAIVTAPILPATTLANECYKYMFEGCTSLTTAPELPATRLAEGCYYRMFRKCTALTTAPELPAPNFTTSCYYQMFYGCSSLNYIKCLATGSPLTNTSGWTNGVSPRGTFVKASSMTSWTTGTSGIPSGWAVQNDVLPYDQQYLTFEALEPTTFKFSGNDLQYSLNNGSTWTTLTSGYSTPQLSTGSKILWKQTGLTPGSYPAGIGTFSATGNFNAYGNVMSLYYGDNFVGQTSLLNKNNAFYYLFYNNDYLIDASNLILPATTLAKSCYDGMFFSCTALTKAPKLPATTLAKSCYYYMFYSCRSLRSTPSLPATTLADGCYRNMFEGCISLTTAPTLPATTLYFQCYASMFNSCTGLSIAPTLPATTLVSDCYSGMFMGCTRLMYIKCLATNISASNCTHNWVQYVTATGTFVKDANTTWPTGISGIPSGWTTINN